MEITDTRGLQTRNPNQEEKKQNRKLIALTIEQGGLFTQQKIKIRSHTAEFKLLAFSVVTASMLKLDLFEKICIFVEWLGRFAPFVLCILTYAFIIYCCN